MSSESRRCILLFVKSPVAGRVKTRLAAKLGHDTARRLYENFVVDTLAIVNNLDTHVRICFQPVDDENKFQQWLGKEYKYFPQTGRDLGQRMKNAFLQAFSDGFGQVIAIGSDIPDLPKEYLNLALISLDSNDAVIGPSSDGGYYLIGFAKDSFVPEAFDDISWSTSRVFDQTIEILRRRGRKTRMLPQWYDIDSPADLKLLLERNKDTAFLKSATSLYLRQNNLRHVIYV